MFSLILPVELYTAARLLFSLKCLGGKCESFLVLVWIFNKKTPHEGSWGAEIKRDYFIDLKIKVAICARLQTPLGTN